MLKTKVDLKRKGAEFQAHGFTYTYDPDSCFCISHKCNFRQKIVWLINWSYFDHFISLVIILNSVLLGMQDYTQRLEPDFEDSRQEQSQHNKNLEQIGMVLSIIFFLECLLKIIAMGFVLHQNSYLRDSWNRLDFFVVLVSLLDYIPALERYSSLKVLRTLRILRPLRSINKVKQMKAMINALLHSTLGILNICGFLFFVLSIFGIFGVHQFMGHQYQRCRTTPSPTKLPEWYDMNCGIEEPQETCSTQFEWQLEENEDAWWLCTDDQTCQTYLDDSQAEVFCGKPADQDYPYEIDTWADSDELIMFNIIGFENYFKSMLTVFVAITLEGWSLMMLNYMDAGSQWISAVFFIFLVIFGAFFALNLVLAQVVESYYESQAVENELMRQEEQKLKTERHAEIMAEKAKDQAIKNEASNSKNNCVEAPDTERGLMTDEKIADEHFKTQGTPAIANSETKLDTVAPEETIQKVKEKKDFSTQKGELQNQTEQDQPKSTVEGEDAAETNARQRSQSSCFVRVIYNIVTSHQFNFMIFCLIIANTLVLAQDGFPSTKEKQDLLGQLNEFFTWVFFVEMLLKLIALGPSNYISDSYNVFDAIVVTFSLVDWIIAKTVDAESLGSGAEALQALKALRLLRMIKLARSWKAMQEILGKTYLAMGDISFVFIILFLFIYIAALLGMEIFANKCRFAPNLDGDLVQDVPARYALGLPMEAPRENFDTTISAITTVFIVSLGEDWPGIMYNYQRVYSTNPLVLLYFIITYSIGNFMLLSLFTAVLLSRFEQNESEDDSDDEDADDENKIEKPCFQKCMSFFRNIKLEYYKAFALKEDANEVEKQIQLKENTINEMLQVKKQQISLQQDAHFMTQKASNSSRIFKSKSQQSLSHIDEVLTGSQKSLADKDKELKDKIQGQSLFCLSPTNRLRVCCFKMSNHKLFDQVVLVFIVVSTIMLAIESPLSDPNNKQAHVLQILDYIMTAIFFSEMCIKIIATGFVACGKHSYIRNGWNVLDFMIVAVSIFSVIFSEYELGFLKALRLFRILRPLRLISRNKSLKMAINSLINSIPDIVNLLIITTFFILMLAILCTTLLAGKFYTCTLDHIDLDLSYSFDMISTKWDCLNYGGEWINPDLNFDTTLQSVLTLMTIQTTEGWIGVMWSAVDAVGINIEPIRDYNRWYIAFFIVLIVIICMLFLNLFVGVVCETYNTEKELLSKNHLLKTAEKDWIDVLLMCYAAKPEKTLETKKNSCHNGLIRFVMHPCFDTFIMLCIITNTIILAAQWYQMDTSITDNFDYLNYVFIVIFSAEAILKITALGCLYFSDNWNRFDFTVVIVTVVVLIIKYIPGLQLDLSTQATIVRVLRMLRVIRIIKRAQKLQIIFQTVLDAIPSMASLGVLLLLFLFLFAVIGMQLFSFVKLQGDLNRQFNFQTFTSSFLLLMRSATGEGWNALMFDTARPRSIDFQCDPNADYESTALNGGVTEGCGKPIAIAYFLIFLFVVCYIFLNLFIAIVVDTYCGMEAAFRLPIKPSDIEAFVEIWKKYDPNADSYIKTQDLSQLLKELAMSETNFFSYNNDQMASEEYRENYIKNLEIPCHNNFQTYSFYDVLVLVCRDCCMMAFYPKTKRLAIEMKLNTRMKEKGYTIPEESMSTFLNQEIVRQNDMQFFFNTNVNSIVDKPDSIELISQLRRASRKIGRSMAKTIDVWKHSGRWEGVYSSKHIILVTKVVRQMKILLKNIKKDSKKHKTGQDVANLPNMKGQSVNNKKETSQQPLPTFSSIPEEQGEDLIKETVFRRSEQDKSPSYNFGSGKTTEDFANFFEKGSDNEKRYSDLLENQEL